MRDGVEHGHALLEAGDLLVGGVLHDLAEALVGLLAVLDSHPEESAQGRHVGVADRERLLEVAFFQGGLDPAEELPLVEADSPVVQEPLDDDDQLEHRERDEEPKDGTALHEKIKHTTSGPDRRSA